MHWHLKMLWQGWHNTCQKRPHFHYGVDLMHHLIIFEKWKTKAGEAFNKQICRHFLFVVCQRIVYLNHAWRCLHSCVIHFTIVKYSIISVLDKIEFSVYGLKRAYFSWGVLGGKFLTCTLESCYWKNILKNMFTEIHCKNLSLWVANKFSWIHLYLHGLSYQDPSNI